MLEQPRYRRPAAGHPRRRRHVGRRRFLGRRRRCSRPRATTSSASRCSSTTTARRRTARAPAAPARTSTTRARSPSASAFRITCSTTRPLQGSGDRPLRRELCRGRDAGAVHRLQPVDQVPRPARHRARARRAGAGDRPLRREPRALPDGGRALYRAREAERDQSYFLFATTREQLDLLRFPLGELPQGARRASSRAASASRSPTSTTARTSASCRRGRYADMIERLQPGAAEPGDIVDLDGRVLGRHDGIIHFTVGQRRGLGIAVGDAALRRAARADAAPRRRRPARGARAPAACGCATSTGSATARSSDALRRAPRGVRQGALDPPAAAGLARALGATASRSSWSTARRASRPARPACSTMRRRPGARARRRLHRAARSATAVAQRGAARRPDRGRARLRRRGGDGGRRSTRARSKRPMRAGRRSTTSCSARCSTPAAQAAIAAAERIGGRILEVGVGTGISLPDYAPHQPARRRRHLGADAAQGAGARRRAEPRPTSTRSP